MTFPSSGKKTLYISLPLYVFYVIYKITNLNPMKYNILPEKLQSKGFNHYSLNNSEKSVPNNKVSTQKNDMQLGVGNNSDKTVHQMKRLTNKTSMSI